MEPGPNPSANHLTPDELNARKQYFDWKRLLRQENFGLGSVMSTRQDILDLWDGALAILDSDNREQHQLLVKDLVDDRFDGHSFILETARMVDKDYAPLISSVKSFLKVFTHPSLLDCLSVDTYVGIMYTSFGGTNGDRAIGFLKRACKSFMKNSDQPNVAGASSTPDTIKLLLKALYELLSRDRRARLHDDLRELFDLLDELISTMNGVCSKADLDALGSRIAIMRRVVASASRGLVTAEVTQDANSGTAGPVQSSFPMDMEIPGGRHDNDLADISQIQILPTRGEIVSDNSEYLPSTNFLQPHVLEDPLSRYIDSSFRLLRHDIFGSVKDVLRDLMKQDDSARAPSLPNNDTRAHLYMRSYIQRIFINPKNELEAVVSFSAPSQLRNMSRFEKCQWWQASARLEEGTLVCFLSSKGDQQSLLFLQVTVKSASMDKKDENKSNLVSEKFPPTITVKLATCVQHELNLLGQLYRDKAQGVLVDFHGLIPATFAPILKNLQRIQREGAMAFQQWVLPSDGDDNERTAIPPPAYARTPGFVFPLDCITKDKSRRIALDPSMPDSINLLELETLTGLDRGQCQGLIAALTREYALIQGPPGTGKSYLGVQLVRVLLAIKARAKLGPILVICYTNHALDQFLKHLLDVGIKKIIRIGGRSQATELEGKNLRVVSKGISKTRVESQTLGRTYNELEQCMETAVSTMKPLHQSRKGLTWTALQSFLSRKRPSIHRQLMPIDSDGFKTKDVHGLSMTDRLVLAKSWLKQWREEESASLFEAIDQAEHHRESINSVHEEINRRALLQADVVGITTTSLARNIETLRRIGAKVIICEEAAEVMEAHVTSALMPGVEHFIQIGDHRQLRPQIQNYSLSLETASGMAWQLDRSQFERRALGEPGLGPAPVAQLDVQRRMRPEISQLIRSVYPNLKDHETVMNLPGVVGMRDKLFWLDHRCDEDTKNDGTRVKSHSNQWEVDMATALVRHLVRQGEYSSTDIALLTPYTGQLLKLKAALSKDFEICLSERDLETLAAEGFENSPEEGARGESHRPIEKKKLLQTLRLATVDNFQGEEAKVIVVSLVRSNSMHKVGFLRTTNRINVLLSRAQHGMYLIGNSETYLHVPMWTDVHGQLSLGNAVGTEFSLCCPRHPDIPILCSEPHDFETKSPEGGCNLPCDRRLEQCGHRCQARCHSAVMHDGFACSQPCPRIRKTCSHECPKLCGEECGPCKAKLHDLMLPCGHKKEMLLCHQTLDLASIKCEFKVDRIVPGCGHTVRVDCFKDVTSDIFCCFEPCSTILGCGHVCPGSCGNCRKETNEGVISFTHSKCKKICNRPHGACNHRCSKLCHDGEACSNCEAKCEVRCSHSACASTCSKACAPCIEKCTWNCPHQGPCSMPCAAPCDRLPCDERCNKTLQCGHQCPSLCGEECPSGLCQKCGGKGDARVDLLEFKTYSETDLDESPIVVLGCGHFFTCETLDGLVGLDEVYTRGKTGNFDDLRNVSVSLASAVPSCPDCKRPIRQFATKRYNRVINRAVMDETCKRFLTKGRVDLERLEIRLKTIEDELDSTRHSQSLYVGRLGNLRRRHAPGHSLEVEALRVSEKMNAEHQPTKKLMDAIALSREQSGDETLSVSRKLERLKISTPEPDNQITLGARLIQIRAKEVILKDKFSLLGSEGIHGRLARSIPDLQPRESVRALLKDCQALITQAKGARLSRIVIAASLTFARMAQLDAWYHRSHPGLATATVIGLGRSKDTGLESAEDAIATARDLLANALDRCSELGGPLGEELRESVEEMARLFEGPRYEEVTPAELASIKSAMVSGRGGIATNSGHWYNCINGHPFAIGECGMPMEMARCPECGASIGGQNHTAVEGVSRAEQMEQ
ncbi:hypothetical protein B0T10DRAFT_436979, partial [Thelonectria olida]